MFENPVTDRISFKIIAFAVPAWLHETYRQAQTTIAWTEKFHEC